MDTKGLAIVAIFTALAVSSDFALADLPNVKLVDAIVFSAAFVFGLETGLYVGVLSELIWGFASPYGFGGYIIPFLVAGECLFALAGWGASKAWAGEPPRIGTRNLYFGAVLALCALAWDFETNLGTAIIVYWPSLTISRLLATEAVGIPFMFSHEVSDMVGGGLVSPFIVFYASRNAKTKPAVVGT